MPIKNLPLRMNPREKANLQGIESLTDIELLALFIRSGSKEEDVLSLSKKIIKRYGSLINMKNIPLLDLQSIKGIGPTKSLEIKCLFEFSKRISKTTEIEYIHNIQMAVKYAISCMALKNREEFFIVFLDEFNKIIYFNTLYKGTQYEMSVNPKDIISLALKVDAKKFYCFHNHPSGIIKPSPADELVTKRLQNYSNLFGIKMLSHIILNSKGDYFLIGK